MIAVTWKDSLRNKLSAYISCKLSWNSWTWLITILKSIIFKSKKLLVMNFFISTSLTLYFFFNLKLLTMLLLSWLNYTHHIMYCPIYSRCSSSTQNQYDSMPNCHIMELDSFSDDFITFSVKNLIKFKMVR